MSSTTNSHDDRYAREIADPDASLVPVSASEAAARIAAEVDRHHAPGRGARIDQEVRYRTVRARTGDQDEHQALDEKERAWQDHAESSGPGAAGRDLLDRARQACTVLPVQTSVAAAFEDTPAEAGQLEADGAAAASGEAVGR
jgi:hypothetical protein